MALNAACFGLSVISIAIAERIGIPHTERWWLLPLIGLLGYAAGRTGMYLWAVLRHWPMITKRDSKHAYARQWAETSRLNRFLLIAPSMALMVLVTSDFFSAGPIWNLGSVHFGAVYVSLSTSILFAFMGSEKPKKCP